MTENIQPFTTFEEAHQFLLRSRGLTGSKDEVVVEIVPSQDPTVIVLEVSTPKAEEQYNIGLRGTYYRFFTPIQRFTTITGEDIAVKGHTMEYDLNLDENGHKVLRGPERDRITKINKERVITLANLTQEILSSRGRERLDTVKINVPALP